jgi:hypothetical protein
MNGLTPEEKQTAFQYALNGADFAFTASPELCNQIAQGCPEAQGINNVMTTILLQRKPVRLDSETVKKYCKGTLDAKNTWLFDRGNITVVPASLKRPEKLKPKEDKTKKEENNDE